MIRILDSEIDQNGEKEVAFRTLDPQEAYEYLLLNDIHPRRIEITVRRVRVD